MNVQGPDPTARFSDRVADYVRWRPTYPPGVVAALREEAGLTPQWAVVDIGCGTGISSELLLRNGNAVCGVEPNAPMRQAAVERLARYPLFRAVDGRAEATGLPDGCADLVVAMQAFHWFDRARARAELARILRPPGWVALVWNTRKTAGSAFLDDYEQLLRQYGTDYGAIRHENIGDDQFRDFFAPAGFVTRTMPNEQLLDCDGLEGRLLSSSYAPARGHPSHAAMLADLRDIFRRRQQNGHIRMEYITEIHIGRVTPTPAPPPAPA